MENALLMLTGIALVVGVVTLLDWLGRRKDRQSRDHAAWRAFGRTAAVENRRWSGLRRLTTM